jgi:hypothetical protein
MGGDDGEKWLSRNEAVALVRSREPMSIGRAKAIVSTARKSGEVRVDVLNDEALSLLSFDPSFAKAEIGPLYSKGDFLDWLDRNRPVPAVQGRAGAPTKHDWPAYEQRFWVLWKDKGDFRKPEDRAVGWNSKASAARALVEIIAKSSDAPPDQKTVEDYIGRWLKSHGV